jgi:hypothetical protein
MRYTYDVWFGSTRKYTTTNFEEAEKQFLDLFINQPVPPRVIVNDDISACTYILTNQDDLDQWSEKLSRDFNWVKRVKLNEVPVSGKFVGSPQDKNVIPAVNPSHYKGYIIGMQWVDAMSLIPTLKDPVKFQAALELQVRKYLDRNGSKDSTLQELKKARWYLSYWIKYLENDCKPIKADDYPDYIKQ